MRQRRVAAVLTSYKVRAVCRHDVEERVRAATVAAVRGTAVVLHAVYGEDIAAERVEVTADVVVTGRAEARLEKIVARVGVEPGVSALSWKAVPTDPEERSLIPEA